MSPDAAHGPEFGLRLRHASLLVHDVPSNVDLTRPIVLLLTSSVQHELETWSMERPREFPVFSPEPDDSRGQ